MIDSDYTYDHLNRLLLARTSDSDVRFTEEPVYDRQGNINSLKRCGIKTHGWSNTYTPNHSLMQIDNLTYTYDGNRVSAIWDGSSNNDPTYTGAQDFHGGGDQQVGEYNYDANGNLFSDFNKGLATIKYNILNLPDTVQHVNGHLLSNSYDATGDKFLAIHRTMNGSGVSMQAGWTYYNYPTGYTIASSTSRMYLDNSEYFSYNLDKILTDDGILVRTNDYSATTPVMGTNYFIRDHLGNVRVVFGDSGSIRQVNNYYPFGMEYGESAETLTELNYQNYLYGGKELDRKFGINAYDFTGRYYDLTDNRFWSMDPMAEKRPWESPYSYCGNNPVNRIDPDGRWDIDVHAYNNRGNSGYAVFIARDKNGNEVYRTVVKTIGTGGRTRDVKNSDTPQGKYQILGYRETGEGTRYDKVSYGPNDLLALDYQGEEGGSRNGMHVHGGRQEGKYEGRTDLASTWGCMRINDSDILELQKITNALEQNDPMEKRGFLNLIDDLKSPVQYSTSADRFNAGTDQFPKTTSESSSFTLTPYVVPVDNTRVVIPYRPDYEKK